MSRDQCQALVADGGHRCPFAAKHRHVTQTGMLLRLCAVHLRTIQRREPNGSDEELAARWLEK